MSNNVPNNVPFHAFLFTPPYDVPPAHSSSGDEGERDTSDVKSNPFVDFISEDYIPDLNFGYSLDIVMDIVYLNFGYVT